MKRPARALLAALLLALCLVAATVPATAASPPPVKQPVATGTGGAIATVDLDASAAGLEVLRHGGNAVDAAVAAAATLGVTEAYSAGIGGGGFMVVYLAGKRRVVTIDGRETAPAAFREDSFIDPATGAPIPSAERITSGLGVGVPGTLATWQRALRRLRHPAAGQAAGAGHPGGRARLRGRPDLPRPDGQQRRPLRRLPRHRRAVPARRGAPGGRVGAAQPRPGPHLPAAGPPRHRPVLPGPHRRGDRRHRPGPAGRPRLDPERPARGDDRGRPGRLPGPGPAPDPGRLPRPPGLRHGPAVQRRLHRRRGPQHPGGLRPGRRSPTPRPCSTTWRRPGWPSPTATAGSATPTTSTCPCGGCSARASPTSAAA